MAACLSGPATLGLTADELGPLVWQEGAVSGGRHGDVLPVGIVKRVRGVAYSMRVAPAASNRMVDGARGVLNNLLADVFVFNGPHAWA